MNPKAKLANSLNTEYKVENKLNNIKKPKFNCHNEDNDIKSLFNTLLFILIVILGIIGNFQQEYFTNILKPILTNPIFYITITTVFFFLFIYEIVGYFNYKKICTIVKQTPRLFGYITDSFFNFLQVFILITFVFIGLKLLPTFILIQ